MISDIEFKNIKDQAWEDSEKFMTSGGYFFSDSYTKDDKVNLENLRLFFAFPKSVKSDKINDRDK